MKDDFLAELNPLQQQAVTFSQGNLLVLAGAGSGKTRVLVHRIAWLLSEGAELQNILAVTFTNKAASEMRNRLEKMLQLSLTPMWIGTFHGLAHRLLRLHWQEAGLNQGFQILDADDQLRLLKKVHKELSLDLERWPVKKSQMFINSNKERGQRSSKVPSGSFLDPTLISIYQTYERACQLSDLVDFTELLLRSYELLQNNQLLREHYQRRFKHILVDEFQDTNAMQYAWIKLLASSGANLTAVGDDDQSIYSWRGANRDNMQRLHQEYADVGMIRLEQNYRSTANILRVANAVIANNNNRLGKELWTSSGDGEPVVLYAAASEVSEACYVVSEIKSWLRRHGKLSEVAILYRSNAQSRVLEEQLLRERISYRVYGGMRFFERAEIKDALAYLRLLINQNDDPAFARVVNLPTRGFGDSAMTVVHDYAKAHTCSLWQAAQALVATNQLPTRSINALNGFMQLIAAGIEQIPKLGLDALVVFMVDLVGLRLYYNSKTEGLESKQARLENLDELVAAAAQFLVLVPGGDGLTLLQEFLSYITLASGEYVSSGDPDGERVNLMTLHSAKGLEFHLVFLCGMEEGLFPHIMSMRESEGLEEERRLCYVGMTRAMRKLYLLYAVSRRLRGTVTHNMASRFLREIPPELVKNDSVLNSVSPALFAPTLVPTIGSHKFRLGQVVRNQYFGEGVITGFDGDGENMSVSVNFRHFGNKIMSLQYLTE